jgi:cytoskeleton protein RodZ
MSDQQEQPAPISTPGQLLRQERELQGRAVQEIAGELHIGAYMVEAIENNRFDVLGAPVFARGHLRKYAALLGLSVERVQQLYQNLSDRPRDQDPVPMMLRDSEPSIPMSPDSKARRTLQRPAKWTIFIAGGVLALAGIVAWVLHASSKSAQQNPVETPVEAPGASTTIAPTVTQAPQSEVARSPANSSSATTLTANQLAIAVSAGKPTATAEIPKSPTTGAVPTSSAAAASPAQSATIRKVRLRFSFTQESWVEVYDARGTRLLYDVGFPGQTRSVDVDPPAQIVLGQATAVSTEANGHAITVPPRRIANQVARFTISADGSAQ